MGMSPCRHAKGGRSRLWQLAIWIVLLALLQGRAAVAAEIVDVATPFPSIDLLPSLSFGDTQERDMTVERPFSASGAKEFITLHGKGPGPVFRWAIAGIRNSGETPRQIVIAMPYQGFVGSGLVWPKPPGGRGQNRPDPTNP